MRKPATPGRRSKTLVRPFTNITVPSISPRVNYCILRVNRTFDGIHEGQPGISYSCGTGLAAMETSRVNTMITWRITASLECDESSAVLPSCLLVGTGFTIVRKDGFAHFTGKFRMIRKQQGQPDVTYFEGTVELLSRSGSHQFLGEACDQENHIEGWLIGRGGRLVPKYTLRAVLVMQGALPAGTVGNAAVNRMSGVLVASP